MACSSAAVWPSRGMWAAHCGHRRLLWKCFAPMVTPAVIVAITDTALQAGECISAATVWVTRPMASRAGWGVGQSIAARRKSLMSLGAGVVVTMRILGLALIPWS